MPALNASEPLPVAPPAARSRARRSADINRVISCRLRTNLLEGSWMEIFSRAHPEAVVQVSDRLELGPGRTLYEVRIRSSQVRSWQSELEAIPGVEGIELLESEHDSELLRIFFHGRSWIPIFREVGLMLQMPFLVHSGSAWWTIIGPQARVKALIARLEQNSGGIQIESVRYGVQGRRQPFLTPRQSEILRAAIAAGYFEVPRRITLTKLAKELGVANSSLSVILATIEKRLVERWIDYL